jgi:hypothetical protein
LSVCFAQSERTQNLRKKAQKSGIERVLFSMPFRLQCLPDDICNHVYYNLHNLNMLEVLNELRTLFKCPFYKNMSWDELFSLGEWGSPNFGGMIFANMKRLTWSIAEDKCSPGLINVTNIMNNSWELYGLLCTSLPET